MLCVCVLCVFILFYFMFLNKLKIEYCKEEATTIASGVPTQHEGKSSWGPYMLCFTYSIWLSNVVEFLFLSYIQYF